jgi:flagellin
MNSVVSYINSSVRNLAVFDLNRYSGQHAKSVERIASGTRLVGTSEDPGAFSVALKLQFSARALDAVEKGLVNAQSFLQAQEGGLVAIGSAVERLNELATMIQDPTRSVGDAEASILEMNQLREEIVRVQGGRLNEQKLFVNFLGDTTDPLSVALGESGQTLGLTRSDFSAGDFSNAWIFILGNEPPYVGIGTDTPEGLAAFGQAGFDTLLQSVSSMLATNGAEQSRVLHALDQARRRSGNLEVAGSRVSDVDVAREVTRLGRASIQMDASRAVMTQANVLGELAVRLLGG